MKTLLCLCLLLLGPVSCLASRTLIDETGRTVVVPDHPHRIICLVPSITDTVFALGAADDVIAVSDFVRYPEEATHKPKVGSILNPSIEAIVALHPDLLLAMPHQNQQAVLTQFERLGLPIFLVDTHGIGGILRSIRSLGHATNRVPQAAALVARLEARIEAVRARVKGKPVVSVFMPISYEPVITISKGSFIADIIEVAGGHSITADLAQEWPHISMEAVIERAPQALLMMQEGSITPAQLKTRPGWDVLPAVRSGRVYFVDRRVEFCSPVAIDALEDLARQFHP